MRIAFIFTFREKHEERSFLTHSRVMSASDEAINQTRPTTLDFHGGSNPDVSTKPHIHLSPLTRERSSSVPDFSKKPEKK
jgi:hypothetical protein